MKKKLKDNVTYTIVEVIPTGISPDKGVMAQVSCLKIRNLKLISRFDYRLENKLINNYDIIKMISYDCDKFTYLKSNDEMQEELKKYVEDTTLIIFNNEYTKNHLKYLSNKKTYINNYFGVKHSDDLIDYIMKKHNLENSNYITDLIYEGLIYESN